ncbi:MAG: head GIN domain-containing protein [Parvularculaceae bacterium]
MRIILGILLGFLFAVGIAAAAAYVAFGGLTDVGERDKSKDVSQSFDLSGYDRIEAAGVFELNVTVGGDFALEVSGTPEAMERLSATVENGELVLDQKRGPRGVKGWRDSLTATVSLPSLRAIDISGVVDGKATGIAAEAFTADLSGVGDLVLTGTCDNLNLDVSGVGDLDASGLKCKTVDVDVSGIGDAKVYASEAVDATVNGIGSITVEGSPSRVEKTNNFIASITVR